MLFNRPRAKIALRVARFSPGDRSIFWPRALVYVRARHFIPPLGRSAEINARFTQRSRSSSLFDPRVNLLHDSIMASFARFNVHTLPFTRATRDFNGRLPSYLALHDASYRRFVVHFACSLFPHARSLRFYRAIPSFSDLHRHFHRAPLDIFEHHRDSSQCHRQTSALHRDTALVHGRISEEQASIFTIEIDAARIGTPYAFACAVQPPVGRRAGVSLS